MKVLGHDGYAHLHGLVPAEVDFGFQISARAAGPGLRRGAKKEGRNFRSGPPIGLARC
jgi:hypothetical protein